jgi:hypothetical protein
MKRLAGLVKSANRTQARDVLLQTMAAEAEALEAGKGDAELVVRRLRRVEVDAQLPQTVGAAAETLQQTPLQVHLGGQ